MPEKPTFSKSNLLFFAIGLIVFGGFISQIGYTQLASRGLAMNSLLLEQDFDSEFEAGQDLYSPKFKIKRVEIGYEDFGICTLENKGPKDQDSTKFSSVVAEPIFLEKSKFFAKDYYVNALNQNKQMQIESEAKILKQKVDCRQVEGKVQKLSCLQKNKKLESQLSMLRFQFNQMKKQVVDVENEIELSVKQGGLKSEISPEAYAGVMRAIQYFAMHPELAEDIKCL